MTTDKIIVAFNIKNLNGRKITYVPEVTKLSDVFREDDQIIDTEFLDGNLLPDNEWQLCDRAGNVLLQGREALEAETGRIDYDNSYGSWVVEDINDCNKEEKDALYQAYLNDNIPSYIDNSEVIKDYAVNEKGLSRIHRIKFYPSNIEVFTSKGVKSFDLDRGYDDEDEAFEAWNLWCTEHADIDPVSVDNFELDIKNHFSLIF